LITRKNRNCRYVNWKQAERWLVPLLVLAGVALRAAQLPFSCIWLDEAFSIRLAREPLLQIVQTLSSDNGSPLFYFLARPGALPEG
jgi:hypothetical protein